MSFEDSIGVEEPGEISEAGEPSMAEPDDMGQNQYHLSVYTDRPELDVPRAEPAELIVNAMLETMATYFDRRKRFDPFYFGDSASAPQVDPEVFERYAAPGGMSFGTFDGGEPPESTLGPTPYDDDFGGHVIDQAGGALPQEDGVRSALRRLVRSV